MIAGDRVKASMRFVGIISSASLRRYARVGSFPVNEGDRSVYPIEIQLTCRNAIVAVRPVFAVRVFGAGVSELNVQLCRLDLSIEVCMNVTVCLLLVLRGAVVRMAMRRTMQAPILSPASLTTRAATSVVRASAIKTLVYCNVLRVEDVSVSARVRFARLGTVKHFRLSAFILRYAQVSHRATVANVGEGQRKGRRILHLLRRVINERYRYAIRRARIGARINLFKNLPFRIYVNVTAKRRAYVCLSVCSYVLALTRRAYVNGKTGAFIAILSPTRACLNGVRPKESIFRRLLADRRPAREGQERYDVLILTARI